MTPSLARQRSNCPNRFDRRETPRMVYSTRLLMPPLRWQTATPLLGCTNRQRVLEDSHELPPSHAIHHLLQIHRHNCHWHLGWILVLPFEERSSCEHRETYRSGLKQFCREPQYKKGKSSSTLVDRF